MPIDSQNTSKTRFTYNKHKSVTCIFDMLKTVIFVLAIAALIFTLFFREANVVGSSMLNTLHENDRVLLTSFGYTPKCNDIIAINAENQIEKRIIKRVIACEGQSLRIDYDTGNVYVDGIKLNENYIISKTDRPQYSYEIPEVIPKGYIFVMGDNRERSLDSRSAKIGLIPITEVIGKAQIIIYPFDRIKYLY